MEIKSEVRKEGISITVKEKYRLTYPSYIWYGLRKETKESLADHITYLKLAGYASFLDEPFNFNTNIPYLKSFFDRSAILDFPHFAFEDNLSTSFLENNFKKARFYFKKNSKPLLPNEDCKTEEGAILAFSLGKDSLLSYGVIKELELPVRLVFFEDFWDVELIHKKKLMNKFQKESKEKIYTVYDNADKIPSDLSINVINSKGIFGSNAMNGYMLMLLPFAYQFGMRYIIFGNEQNFNDFFVNEENYKCYPSYEQSSEWMIEQNKALGEFTNNQVRVMSLIEPLYNIAEVKVLFNRYPEMAKYQMSCSHTISENKKNRWCYSCPMCAKAFLYLAANKIEPKKADFKINFFDKKFEKLYPLFNKKPERVYEKPKAVRDEQLLAFYLAYKNKSRGYLIEKFREKFLKEAIERGDELYNKFFKIYDAVSIPGKIKREINSIYREELNK